MDRVRLARWGPRRTLNERWLGAVLRTEDLPRRGQPHRLQTALTTAYRSITAQLARPQRSALPDALCEIRLQAGEATRSPILGTTVGRHATESYGHMAPCRPVAPMAMWHAPWGDWVVMS